MMRSKSSRTSGASSTCAISGALFQGRGAGRLLASQAQLQIGAGFFPGHGLAGGDDVGEAGIGLLVERGARLFLPGFFGNGFQNKTVGGLAGALGGAGNPGLEFFGQADSGGGGWVG